MIGNKPVIFNGLFVAAEPFPGQLLPLCTGSAVVAVWINRYSASRKKLSPDLNIFRIHKFYQILHYDIHTILVKIPVITEAEKVQLE